MRAVAIDCETSIFNKGNAFDSRNILVCWSFATDTTKGALQWPDHKRCQDVIDSADLLVMFNGKFDYHWLAKEGLNLSNKQIWDVQIAEFILSHQTHKFPSLDDTCERLGIAKKLDVVKTQYWDKGISTEYIPWPILRDYAAHDADVTLQCYYAQIKQMTPQQKRLCQLMCMDMHVLREMEATGVAFDEELCKTRAEEVDKRIQEIRAQLGAYYCDVPINFNSGDHLSAFLYGGVVKEDGKEHVGFYKTGEKAGQPKYKNIVIEHILPRLYEPLKGTALQKEGMFATDEGTLRKLKGKKGVITLLLELSKLEKLNGTYYCGLVELRETMHWEPGILHGQFNQTTAGTGRLSSSKPNLQNFASELQDIFITTY